MCRTMIVELGLNTFQTTMYHGISGRHTYWTVGPMLVRYCRGLYYINPFSLWHKIITFHWHGFSINLENIHFVAIALNILVTLKQCPTITDYSDYGPI